MQKENNIKNCEFKKTFKRNKYSSQDEILEQKRFEASFSGLFKGNYLSQPLLNRRNEENVQRKTEGSIHGKVNGKGDSMWRRKRNTNDLPKKTLFAQEAKRVPFASVHTSDSFYRKSQGALRKSDNFGRGDAGRKVSKIEHSKNIVNIWEEEKKIKLRQKLKSLLD